MCECGGELVECLCGDRCCDDCGCRNDVLCTDDDPYMRGREDERGEWNPLVSRLINEREELRRQLTAVQAGLDALPSLITDVRACQRANELGQSNTVERDLDAIARRLSALAAAVDTEENR